LRRKAFFPLSPLFTASSSLSLSALHRTWQRGLEKGGGRHWRTTVYLGTAGFRGKKGRETFVEAMFGFTLFLD
jgi:hypothetical protein